MKINDKDEIIKRMISGSETITKNKNLKVFRRKNKDGKVSKSYKNRIGRHMNFGINSSELETGE